MEVDQSVIPSTSMDNDIVNETSITSPLRYGDQNLLNASTSDNSISDDDTMHKTYDRLSATIAAPTVPFVTDPAAIQDSVALQMKESEIHNDILLANSADNRLLPNASDSELKVNGSSAMKPPKILSGKPKAFAIDASKAARSLKSSAATKTGKVRRKRVAVTACLYQSQITDNFGIKLKLKKSATPIKEPNSRKRTSAAGATPLKGGRKRSRKSKHDSDSDDSDYERRRRKESTVNNNTTSERVKHRKSVKHSNDNHEEPLEQSVWGSTIPEQILDQIFTYAINQDGCLPTIVNVGKVCSLWNRVSLSPKLWHSLDLSTWVKDRNELVLKWIIENRLHPTCTELNLANWKVTNIDCVLKYLREFCPNLVSLNLSSWKGITSDHLNFLAQEFKSLSRIDLSSINFEMYPNKAGVGPQSICNAIQILGDRLTHLYLAHNRLGGVPQIITALSAHSTNLQLLDLSNVSTVAASHGILHIEKLQNGCSALKVLRVTNSHLTLSCATLEEQMDSPGFPELEELSVASLTDDSRLMSDEGLQRLLKTSTKLKLLDVRGCVRLTHDTFIRLPAWDLKHLFLSGCSVTRDAGSGLELIASKWAHSLTELDLAWANMQEPLDNALKAIAEKGNESLLNHLNLCGSSVSLEAVKKILTSCPRLSSINLSSCRGLPRGVKRLMQGAVEIKELRENLGVENKEES